MKTKILMFGIIALLAFAMFANSLVLAEDNSFASEKCFGSTDNLSKCSGNNSNNIKYNTTNIGSSRVFWKEVGLWFTFNQERKMEKEMELAQMRLQQAEFATAHNRTQAAEKALDEYEKLITRAEKRSEFIKDGNGTDSRMLKLAAMDQAIFAHQERIQKLSDYLATTNLTDEQKAKIQPRLNRAENVTAHLQEVQSRKEDKIKTRLMAEKNLTEAEAETKIAESKDRAEEIVDGAKEAWKNLKDDSKNENKTPKEFMEERRQETKNEMRNEIRSQRPNKIEIENESD